MTLCDHFYQKDLQQDLGKFLPDTHPGATSKWDVLKPGGVGGGFSHETLRLELFLVGEDLCHIVGVTDAVNDIPAFGNLVTLKWQEGKNE